MDMKKFFMALMLCLTSLTAAIAGEKQTVVFNVDLHCQGCIDKIYKNIAYEKGVRDLVCNLDHQTVKVVFDTEKTDVKTLQMAFAKLGKTANVNTELTEAASNGLLSEKKESLKGKAKGAKEHIRRAWNSTFHGEENDAAQQAHSCSDSCASHAHEGHSHDAHEHGHNHAEHTHTAK